MRTVGDYVRHWRREAGLTRHQLAQRAGVRYSYVCQIERNRAGLPREPQLRALAAVLAPSPEDGRMLLDLANPASAAPCARPGSFEKGPLDGATGTATRPAWLVPVQRS
jgi:transcriptional regulator with XRE-family HTH domain